MRKYDTGNRFTVRSPFVTFVHVQCLKQYISFEVMEGAYDVSCPDPSCATQVKEF